MNKKTFSKKFISILAFVLSFTFACSPLASAANVDTDDVISPQSLYTPTQLWNWNNGPYEFSGVADSSDLYTNYYFTNASQVVIHVDNLHETERLKVRVIIKRDQGIQISTDTTYIEPGHSEEWTVNLDSNKSYFLRFSGPSDFEGWINRS